MTYLQALIKEARAVLAEHMDICDTCTMLVLCAEAEPLEQAIQQLAARHLVSATAGRVPTARPRCECGLAATLRLRYVPTRGGQAGRPYTGPPKCARCADKAAFTALAYATFHVDAIRLEVSA